MILTNRLGFIEDEFIAETLRRLDISTLTDYEAWRDLRGLDEIEDTIALAENYQTIPEIYQPRGASEIVRHIICEK